MLPRAQYEAVLRLNAEAGDDGPGPDAPPYLEDLSDKHASSDLLRAVNRTDEFMQWQQRYLRS